MEHTFCTKWKMLPLVSALLLAVAGCGGGAGTTSLPASGASSPAASTATTTGSAASSGTILPAGSALPTLPDELSSSASSSGSRVSSSAMARSASDVQNYPGASFIQAAGATVDGDTVVLQSTSTEVAWALYQISGLQGMYTASFSISATPGGDGQQYSVGASNFSDGRWQYFINSSDSQVDVDLRPNTKRLISLLGNLYYVVVVSGGDSVTVNSAALDVSSTPPDGSAPERPGCPLGLYASRGESVETLAWLADPNATSYEIYRRVSNRGPHNWDGLMPPPPGGGQGQDDGQGGNGMQPPPPPPGGGQGQGGGQGGDGQQPPPPPPGGGQGGGDDGQQPPPPPPGGGQGGGQGGDDQQNPPADFELLATVTDTGYVDSSAVLDTFYEYQVKAINAAGQSAASNIALGFASDNLHLMGAIEAVSADAITVTATTFAITADTKLLDKAGQATTIDSFAAGDAVAVAGVRNGGGTYTASEIRALPDMPDPGLGHFSVCGALTAIDSSTLTVGDKVFSFDADTKFLLADGTAGTAADFAVGDQVGIAAEGEPGDATHYAKVVQKLPAPPPGPPGQ
jgi:hypothetical protein